MLILQSRHNLSDERTEYLIRDRLSFMRFLGLGLADTVPDANTGMSPPSGSPPTGDLVQIV